MNDIILNKKESIERCVKQIREYYRLSRDEPFETDFLLQDAIAVNLQRACQQTLDLANHVVKNNKLGLPKESRQSFQLLFENKVINREILEKMQKMVGFRNVLVHQYQELDIDLMKDIVENHLDDLIEYTRQIMKHYPQ